MAIWKKSETWISKEDPSSWWFELVSLCGKTQKFKVHHCDKGCAHITFVKTALFSSGVEESLIKIDSKRLDEFVNRFAEVQGIADSLSGEISLLATNVK